MLRRNVAKLNNPKKQPQNVQHNTRYCQCKKKNERQSDFVDFTMKGTKNIQLNLSIFLLL